MSEGDPASLDLTKPHELAQYLFHWYERNYYEGHLPEWQHPAGLKDQKIWDTFANKILAIAAQEAKSDRKGPPHVDVPRLYNAMKAVVVMPGALPTVEQLQKDFKLRPKLAQLQSKLDELVYYT
jgi:hypothetical protein